ncbi:MAG: hypothetical protein J6Y01_08640 [Spirochaetales bacterium]|nr:hypothetical protein [Spirochaetales bacterium]
MNIDDILNISDDFIKNEFESFCNSYNELYQKKQSLVSRENRLINLRFRLTLDLTVSIETKFSETKTEQVNQTYILLYKFFDLWNVYEVCCASGEKLCVCEKKNWNTDFMLKTKTDICLSNCVKEMKQCLSESVFCKYFCSYLDHFANLDSISANNQQRCIELKNKIKNNNCNNIANEDMLPLMYMERNAFYHGGEAARAGSNYNFRIKILSVYIQTLRVLISRLGAGLFKRELKNDNDSTSVE